jgi:hypothetical protein
MASNCTENAPLSARQEAAALALARGCTTAEAAEESGAAKRTILAWSATLPAFRRRVQALRGEMTGQALGRMVNNMNQAAEKLRSLLEAESETVRLGAARSILELGIKFRETVELEERVAELEARVAAKEQEKAR